MGVVEMCVLACLNLLEPVLWCGLGVRVEEWNERGSREATKKSKVNHFNASRVGVFHLVSSFSHLTGKYGYITA